MENGDIIVFGNRRDHSNFNSMTVGKSYAVIEYDANQEGWPHGCCGKPFVTITNDRGSVVTLLADRFDAQAKTRESN
jgi:hypothetical protein